MVVVQWLCVQLIFWYMYLYTCVQGMFKGSKKKGFFSFYILVQCLSYIFLLFVSFFFYSDLCVMHKSFYLFRIFWMIFLGSAYF